MVSWPVVMILAGAEPGRLLALKFRGPLVEERANSLSAVFREITANLLLDLMLEGLQQFLHFAAEESLFYGPDGHPPPRRDFLPHPSPFPLYLRSPHQLLAHANTPNTLL